MQISSINALRNELIKRHLHITRSRSKFMYMYTLPVVRTCQNMRHAKFSNLASVSRTLEGQELVTTTGAHLNSGAAASHTTWVEAVYVENKFTSIIYVYDKHAVTVYYGRDHWEVNTFVYPSRFASIPMVWAWYYKKTKTNEV